MIEAKAIDLLSRHNIVGFPGDLRVLARLCAFDVIPKPGAEGVSGGIVFITQPPVIFYREGAAGTGFINFTVGHELGHAYLPGHSEEIQAEGGVHQSPSSSFARGRPIIEQEADEFAASLIFPKKPSRELLSKHEPSLDAVRALAEAGRGSLTAAAHRATTLDVWPCAFVVVKENLVTFSFISSEFRQGVGGKWPRKGDLVPSGSPAAAMSGMRPNPERYKERVTERGDWFDQSTIQLREETVCLGRFGALVFLTPTMPIVDEGDWDDEDEALIESWTPRFRR